jgi:hypothetical protein
METKEIIETFCDLYKKFKRENPNAKKDKLKKAFNSICFKIYTESITELRQEFSIETLEEFYSFVAKNLKNRRDLEKRQEDALDAYIAQEELKEEEEQKELAKEKARQDKKARKKLQGYDVRPTYVFH